MPPPRARLTHFLCLPLVNSASRPQWQASLKKFLDEGSATDLPAVCQETIRPLGTLHITIGVLSLPTSELEQAARVMLHSDEVDRILRESMKLHITKTMGTLSATNNDKEEAKQQIDQVGGDSGLGSTSPCTSPTDPEPLLPLTTTFSGLQAMHSPNLTSVLFAPPTDPESRVHHLCISLQRVFQAANLMVQENRPLNLHATILNTIYASHGSHQQGSVVGSGSASRRKRTRQKPMKFDATKILERYADFEWARDVRLEKLSLCKMGARKKVENGEVVDEEYEEVDFCTFFPYGVTS